MFCGLCDLIGKPEDLSLLLSQKLLGLRVLLLCHGLNEVALLLLRLFELRFQSGDLIGQGEKSRFLLLE
jgi:hypothetical protein